jgi:hypothetical protein
MSGLAAAFATAVILAIVVGLERSRLETGTALVTSPVP